LFQLLLVPGRRAGYHIHNDRENHSLNLLPARYNSRMGAPFNIPRRALTVDEYHKMGEAGVLKEDDRVELIEGELIKMAPIGGRHLQLVNLITGILVFAVEDKAVVSTQNPILLPPYNEPQPDIVLLAPEVKYRQAVPTVEDILLVIEIADTTLVYDRDTKIPIYARHGIPEAWVLDAANERTFIFLQPGPQGYRQILSPKREETISPSLLPGVEIKLSDIWRRR
jgi:Uma2 family endonuclease